MYTSLDLICVECSDKFDSASLLLQHFANHAFKHLESDITLKNEHRKNKIPNLYPISMMYDMNVNETDRGSDSGIEDVNPLKFCMVTMEDKQTKQAQEFHDKSYNVTSSPKKYQCNYCLRKFGWSTDLKRHILIHTGERPFQCPDCSSSFTRNFLLQKHQKKIHGTSKVAEKLPELMPISEVLNKKRRKQHKCLIKHNMSSVDECVNDRFEFRL